MLNLRNYHVKNLYDLQKKKEFVLEISKLEDIKSSGGKPSILSNTMFKTMFYNSNRLKYSAKLISDYIEISYDELIKNIKLEKNEFNTDYLDTKKEEGDFVAEINHSKIGIEINNNDKFETMSRNMDYAFRLYSQRVKSGTSYKKIFNQVIQLNINNFAFLGNDKIVDIYYFQNEEGIVLNPKLTFIQIYVPNLRKKCYNQGIESLNEKEKYLLGLIEEDEEICNDIRKDLDIMKEYIDEAMKATNNKTFEESYSKEYENQEQRYRDGIEEGISLGRAEGISLGRAEGISLGRENTIKELVSKMNQKGISIQDMMDLTELSESEINSILGNQ